ncbi:hypothetical protein ACQKM9_03830 [Viridibacillus sp. NPDC093762]|uniref:hypothetical protein n=1 Tax=Viridibacillus sp. NPDC093762 TaxID=3390720 RepID=UPI003CFCD25F
MKINKLFASIAAVGILTIGLGSFANGATSYYGYGGKVPTVNDLESTNAVKDNSASAYNFVQYIQRGKLVSWVENTSGSNVSQSGTYSARAVIPMDYLGNASSLIGKNLHLNISTSTGTVESVDTDGEWTPS